MDSKTRRGLIEKIDEKTLKDLNSDFLNGEIPNGRKYSPNNYITDLKVYLSKHSIPITRVLKKVYSAIELKRKEDPETAFIIEREFKSELERGISEEYY